MKLDFVCFKCVMTTFRSATVTAPFYYYNKLTIIVLSVTDTFNCMSLYLPVITTFLGWFLDLLVNCSVSKPSVNCNLLVEFVHVSEQNLDCPLAN